MTEEDEINEVFDAGHTVEKALKENGYSEECTGTGSCVTDMKFTRAMEFEYVNKKNKPTQEFIDSITPEGFTAYLYLEKKTFTVEISKNLSLEEFKDLYPVKTFVSFWERLLQSIRFSVEENKELSVNFEKILAITLFDGFDGALRDMNFPVEDFALGFVIYGDELKEALRKSFEKLIPKSNRAEFIY